MTIKHGSIDISMYSGSEIIPPLHCLYCPEQTIHNDDRSFDDGFGRVTDCTRVSFCEELDQPCPEKETECPFYDTNEEGGM